MPPIVTLLAQTQRGIPSDLATGTHHLGFFVTHLPFTLSRFTRRVNKPWENNGIDTPPTYLLCGAGLLPASVKLNASTNLRWR